MVDVYKTSQTSWSLTEGKDAPGGSQDWGTEPTGAPAPVTQPIKGEIMKIDAMQTSQQKAGDHATVESGD